MANENVSLSRYCKSIDRGWYRKSLDIQAIEATRKGRGFSVRWDDDKSLYGSDVIELGAYQLRFYEGSKSKYMGAGHELQHALNQRDRKITDLAYEEAARQAGRVPVPDDPSRKNLLKEKANFLSIKESAGMERKTVLGYETVLAEFFKVCGKTFADQITERDVLNYCAGLRRRGLAARSVENCYASVAAFLNHLGIDHKRLVKKEHRPKETKHEPVEYAPDDVERFLRAIDNPRHALFFEMLLTCGLREREASCLEFANIDYAHMVITIMGEKTIPLKLTNGVEKEVRFRTKTRDPRTVAMTEGLAERLQQWHLMNPDATLVFPTKRGCVDNYLLRACKRIQHRHKRWVPLIAT